MDLLKNLENMLGGALSGDADASAPSSAGASAAGGLGGLLSPDVLGGLASALLGNKVGAGSPASPGNPPAGMGGLGALLTSLMAGGGAGILGKLLGGGEAGASPQSAAAPAASPADVARRTIRALVYAAKADGHIDDRERAAITDQVRKLNLGQEVQTMLHEAMDEPLEPARIAQGVTDPREAASLFALSCAVANPDNFMERSYIDGLATALRIPDNVKTAIESRLHQA